MKTTKLISGVVSILVLLAFTLGYAEEEKANVDKEGEESPITWVNTEYGRRSSHSQKITDYPDGRWEAFYWESDTTPAWTGSSTTTDQWTDSEGNTWYKLHWKSEEGFSAYELGKVNKTETVLEYVNSPTDYPTELDPNDPTYHIYYRK